MIGPNKYRICSTALLMVGASPINGFTGASTEEVVAEAMYESALLNVLSMYRWRFASQNVDLARTDALLDRWDAEFQLPPGVTVIFGVFVGDDRLEFDRVGDKIHANPGENDLVTALIGFRPDERDFPPYFVSALEYKLASMFAIPIAEDAAKAQSYDAMFARQFAQAKSVESQGRTASKMPVGGLRRYHRGRA